MVELVQLLKELSKTTNDAGEPFEHRKGTVESVNPVTVRVDQKLILEEDDLILTHLVRDYDVDISVSHETEDFELVEGALTGYKKSQARIQGQKTDNYP